MTRTHHLGLTVCLIAMPWVATAKDAALWPPSVQTGPVRWALTGNYNYDFNRSGSGKNTHSEQTFRRSLFGFRATDKNRWDAFVYYDFKARRWLDVTLAAQTSWLFGTDAGRIRVGHARVPIGLETIDPAHARSFIEMALPAQAFFHNRRTGIDWALDRKHFVLNAAYYMRGDLQGGNGGRTVAARAIWLPRNTPGHVLHLGGSTSIEHPRAHINGLGQYQSPRSRFQTGPEAGLTPSRLVDTGPLDQVHSVHRQGLEAVWIEGPYSIQAEAMRTRVLRHQQPNFTGQGYYVFGSYVLTGESRGHARGQATNVIPRGDWGAWEILARYSAIDLDDGSVRGGREHNLTFGANWYINRYFKYQINQVFAYGTRQGIDRNDRILEMRMQLQF